MAYIYVDLDKLDAASQAVSAYLGQAKLEMKVADGVVKVMAQTWAGQDGQVFQAKWKALDAQDSAYAQMAKQLKSNAAYLDYAQTQYKKAQTRAIQRARLLSSKG